ncbi:hypothetical protein BJ322DRAFT_1176726 [Thelephora terrestris]|uniref:Mok11-13/Ags1-like CBM domain-containing protein n=1 Tax=Thelephora terrestris TaxID=56493 RepID=A0A9P6H209_9AGAM|nr:hypothetical protein BJ322DRAFT_1176726 [Thelephora terrestris]
MDVSLSLTLRRCFVVVDSPPYAQPGRFRNSPLSTPGFPNLVPLASQESSRGHYRQDSKGFRGLDGIVGVSGATLPPSTSPPPITPIDELSEAGAQGNPGPGPSSSGRHISPTDDDYFYGDVDGDGVLDRLPPNSAAPSYVNMTAPPEPFIAWMSAVDDATLAWSGLTLWTISPTSF